MNKIIEAMVLTMAAKWGVTDFESLTEFMDSDQIERANKLCPAPRSVIAAVFPYGAGQAEGNLSLYARGEDYHRVVMRKLEKVCSALRSTFEGFTFTPCVDSSPLPEREAALSAGLGILGDNGLIFCPPYGSFVFIGCILTDMPASFEKTERKECLHCGLCQKHCPTGALCDGKVDAKKCLTDITQRKGELTEEEIAVIKKEGTAWGCDVCQNVCPMNKDANISPIFEFTGSESYPLLANLEYDEIKALGSREFLRLYDGRAFTWRGKAVLERNLEILDKTL